MNRKVRIKYFSSYKEADNDMLREYFAMPPSEKVAIVNAIRRKIFALKGIKADNSVKRVISCAKRV